MSKNTRVTDPDVVLTIFPRAAASMSEAKVGRMKWSKLAERLKAPSYCSDKDSAQLLIPVLFKDEAERKTLDNVEEVYLGTLDVDGLEEEPYQNLVDWLEEEGLKAILYSTWSHIDSIQGIGKKAEKVGGPCYCVRVLLPLSRPVQSYEWPYFWEALNTHCFDLADRQCKDASRGYYVPAMDKKHKGKSESSLYLFREFKGDGVLDVDWLLQSYEKELKEAGGSFSASLPDQANAHSVSKEVVKSFAKKLNGRKSPAHSLLGAKMLQALRGEIFEVSGHRDKTIFQMAKELAQQFPQARVKDLVKPFEESFSAMSDASEDAPTIENFADKILRAQSEVIAEAKLKEAENQKKKIEAARREKLTEKAEKLAEDSSLLFDDGVVDAFLDNTGGGTDKLLMPQRLIIQYGEQYYLFNGTGYVGGNIGRNGLVPACKAFLQSAAKPLGFSLYLFIANDEGPPQKRIKTPAELMDQYGTIAMGMQYNLVGKSYYEESSKILHISECFEANVEAACVPEVDAWIDSLGNKGVAESFRNWLSQVPDTGRALAALVLIGQTGLGKSSLAEGISMLWKAGAYAKMSEAFDSFNESLVSRPVLLADEEIPSDYRGRVHTEKLRSVISAGTHYINRKGRPVVQLSGFYRNVIALNHSDQLRFSNNRHSRSDLDALRKRLLIIDTTSEENSGFKELFKYDLFVTQRGLAKHAKWLAETTERKDARFGVVTDSYETLMMADRSVTDVLSWLMTALMARSVENLKVSATLPGAVIVRNGRVLVNARRMVDTWNTHGDEKFAPTAPALLKSLGVFCREKVAICINNKNNISRWWLVDEGVLQRFARRHQYSEVKLELMLKIFNDINIVKPVEYREIPDAAVVAREDAIIALSNLYEDHTNGEEEVAE